MRPNLDRRMLQKPFHQLLFPSERGKRVLATCRRRHDRPDQFYPGRRVPTPDSRCARDWEAKEKNTFSLLADSRGDNWLYLPYILNTTPGVLAFVRQLTLQLTSSMAGSARWPVCSTSFHSCLGILFPLPAERTSNSCR